jgi:hypothetical protein
MCNEEDLSPYTEFARTLIEEDVAEPLMDADFPQELSIEVWNKLVEHRDKKVQSEKDVRLALRRYNRHQLLATSITVLNEEVRSKLEKTQKDYEEIQELKFQSLYNVETLFSLKQGQVMFLIINYRSKFRRHLWLLSILMLCL